MINYTKTYAIFGAGGQAKESFEMFKRQFSNELLFKDHFIGFFVNVEVDMDTLYGFPVMHISKFVPSSTLLNVAIGDSKIRKKITESLPHDTEYFTIIDPSATVFSSAKIGSGSTIGINCIISSDVEIGKQSHLNYGTIISHDTKIGDFFTSAPSVNVTGTNKIGNQVYMGCKSATKQKITIADETTIGMGAIVVKDISEAGTYIGVPAKKISTDVQQLVEQKKH